jgi:uncharacterized membrane protein
MASVKKHLSKHHHFSKKEAIKFGFNVAKSNVIFFLGVGVVWAFITIISQGLQSSLNSDNQFIASFLVSLVMWVIGSMISMGIIYITLQFVDKKKPQVKDVFYTKNLFNYILASIMKMLIVLVGYILLIIPGIIFSIKLQYSEFLIVDKGMDAVDSLKGSWELTKGVKWNLFLFGILLALINILGFLALLLGLLVTVPLSMVANAYVYRKLLSQTNLK